MSKKTEIRNRNRAVTAYNLRLSGHTYNHIAGHLGVKPHQVKGLILLGERLESLKEEV